MLYDIVEVLWMPKLFKGLCSSNLTEFHKKLIIDITQGFLFP